MLSTVSFTKTNHFQRKHMFYLDSKRKISFGSVEVIKPFFIKLPSNIKTQYLESGDDKLLVKLNKFVAEIFDERNQAYDCEYLGKLFSSHKSMLEDKKARIFLVTDKNSDDVLASALIKPSLNSQYAVLDKMFVSKKARGLGIGQYSFFQTLKTAFEMGYKYLIGRQSKMADDYNFYGRLGDNFFIDRNNSPLFVYPTDKNAILSMLNNFKDSTFDAKKLPKEEIEQVHKGIQQYKRDLVSHNPKLKI